MRTLFLGEINNHRHVTTDGRDQKKRVVGVISTDLFWRVSGLMISCGWVVGGLDSSSTQSDTNRKEIPSRHIHEILYQMDNIYFENPSLGCYNKIQHGLLLISNNVVVVPTMTDRDNNYYLSIVITIRSLSSPITIIT